MLVSHLVIPWQSDKIIVKGRGQLALFSFVYHEDYNTHTFVGGLDSIPLNPFTLLRRLMANKLSIPARILLHFKFDLESNGRILRLPYKSPSLTRTQGTI
jgi:hypothetical protein